MPLNVEMFIIVPNILFDTCFYLEQMETLYLNVLLWVFSPEVGSLFNA